jgi:hypothetical protein
MSQDFAMLALLLGTMLLWLAGWMLYRRRARTTALVPFDEGPWEVQSSFLVNYLAGRHRWHVQPRTGPQWARHAEEQNAHGVREPQYTSPRPMIDVTPGHLLDHTERLALPHLRYRSITITTVG